MRLHSLLSLSITLASSALAQSVDLGPFVNPANGHVYYRLSHSDWTSAETAAVQLGGHLVTINDAQENDWVFNAFSQTGQYGLWIGLNDVVSESAFVWVDGEPFTAASYQNWANGQPDNWNPSWYPEDYGMMFVEEGGLPSPRSRRWNDIRNVERENLPTSNSGGWLQGVVEIEPPPFAMQAYGVGCGSPPLTLQGVAAAPPRINSTAQAIVDNIPATFVVMAAGWNRTSLGPWSLPLPLTQLGMPGCDLLQSTDFFGLALTTTGPFSARFDQPVPNNATLVGLHLHLQAFAVAPGANPAQVILSNGLMWRIGT